MLASRLSCLLLGLVLSSSTAWAQAPNYGLPPGMALPDPKDLEVLTCFASDPAVMSNLTAECQTLVPLIPQIIQGAHGLRRFVHGRFLHGRLQAPDLSPLCVPSSRCPVRRIR